MKSLQQIIQENFKFKINRDSASYKPEYNDTPSTYDELKNIIVKKYKKYGPGTKDEPVDFNDIDVSNIESFYEFNTGLFDKSKFRYIDVSEWDVSNCKDFRLLFSGCEKLESVGDLSNWDIRSAEFLNCMFKDCKKLRYIGDLSRWNTMNVKWTNCMFENCESLESIGDISRWDTESFEYIFNMFNNCFKLSNIGDFTKWNMPNLHDQSTSLIFKNTGITQPQNWPKIAKY